MKTVTLTAPNLHPDYLFWAPAWSQIRDAEIGEMMVKRKAQVYLPRLQGHDHHQYAAYLHRAVFYNMTSKTLSALYGTMFRRDPRITLPPNLALMVGKFSKDGTSLILAAKNAAKEVLAVGRYGMLVDSREDGAGTPYVACYTAENILDWSVADDVTTRVVLRELYREGVQDRARYRVLTIEPGHYEQHIYFSRDITTVPDLTGTPDELIIPTVRGEVLGYIPFQFIGPFTNSPEIQKPPLLDIVSLNFAHYQSYAQLEQGRFYTANPVYTVTAGSDAKESPEYYVGPDVVWELDKDGKAAILEFTGHGLNSLENALRQKEAQIAAISGRMMPGNTPGLSDNDAKMREANESTLLLNIADTLDEAFTKVLRWWADWNNAPAAKINKIEFEVNRDFLVRDIGAREFRAIHQMYADGVIPLSVFFEYLRKAEVIPDWLEESEFAGMLSDPAQFPNMVNVLARMRGYPDTQAYMEDQRAAA